ncbi:hypothetical protein [Janthinobacterium fluminis]|uniref:Prolin-rich transmembrane protein n=1 Tax=Janthinobacterium fluminis TaxID=2987524 RepID=A0ABT5JYH3_9BURK|nr:hypothetical protein [Janthinobacterium fluminis]MDC8757634.1 hypothetical protein [Janthinobacterium fluminis]
MTPRHLALAAALAGAAALAAFGDSSPAVDVAEAVVRGAAAPAPARRAASAAPAAAPLILALRPRAELIGEAGEFAGADAAFQSQDWTPPPAPPPTQEAAPPAPPPSAPPLPFTCIGKAAAGGSWEVFLARADKTYIVRSNSVIDGQYRVDAIAPPLMTLTYLPLNQVQQLNIGVPD